jgi:hypothetical protein
MKANDLNVLGRWLFFLANLLLKDINTLLKMLDFPPLPGFGFPKFSHLLSSIGCLAFPAIAATPHTRDLVHGKSNPCSIVFATFFLTTSINSRTFYTTCFEHRKPGTRNPD